MSSGLDWVPIAEVSPPGWPIHKTRRALIRLHDFHGGLIMKVTPTASGRWLVNRSRLNSLCPDFGANTLVGRGDFDEVVDRSMERFEALERIVEEQSDELQKLRGRHLRIAAWVKSALAQAGIVINGDL